MFDSLDLDGSFLSEEHRMLRDQVRKFVAQEVSPHLDTWEAAGTLPRDIYEKLGAAGFLGISYPPEYGGSGLGTLAALVMSEECVRTGYVGFAANFMTHSEMAALHLVRAGTQEQKDKYLPDIIAGRKICALGVTEPRGGSDLVRMATNARKDGNEWVLNGQKLYITNANIADLFFVIARTDPEAKGGKGFTLFLLERGMEGLSNGLKTNKIGQHCSDNGELVFDNVRIPPANIIGEEGLGFYTMMQGIEHERIVICAQAVAAAELALELTLDWVKLRKAYGGVIWDLQAVRHELARLSTELAAAKTWLYHSAAQAERGGDTKLSCAMLKAHIPELAERILYKAVQFHGAMGYMDDTPVQRISRDIRVFPLAGGGTEIMLDEVAKRI
ncbi:MAG: acyl-CoA dehydrogenase family protein [Sphingobium sp.]